MSTQEFSASRQRPRSTLSSIIGAAAWSAAVNVIYRSFGQFTAPERDGVRRASRGTPGKASAPATTPAEDQSGKGADTPAEIPGQGWWAILKRTFAEVNNDRVLAVAGGVTFYSLLSLFPAITVAVSFYGLFNDPQSISQHLQSLSSFLPEGAMSIIGEQVQRIVTAESTGLTLAAVFGLLLAIWSANSAMKALIDALNIAYDAEEKRGFIKLNLVSMALTLGGILGLIVMIGVIAVVPAVLQLFWLGGVADALLFWGRWPLAFALILVALAVLYQWGPSRPGACWRWITPGSALASVGLILFSILFSGYAPNFAEFNETYGSLGAVIGFLTWLWLSATIILVGAELNAEIENQARPGKKPGETAKEKA